MLSDWCWVRDEVGRYRLDEIGGEEVRLWNNLAVSRVKLPLPRFASDSRPHINNMHNKGTFTHRI